MSTVRLEIKNLARLQQAFAIGPMVTRTWVNKAIKAGILEVSKQAVDSNFQFKTPRAFRTGLLQQSFKFGLVIRDMYASVGPTVRYAETVHEGLKGYTANPFMQRIGKAAQPDIQKHFDKAADNAAEEIARNIR